MNERCPTCGHLLIEKRINETCVRPPKARPPRPPRKVDREGICPNCGHSGCSPVHVPAAHRVKDRPMARCKKCGVRWRQKLDANGKAILEKPSGLAVS